MRETQPISAKRGRLITFEGPEGGGKSTHAAALAQRLKKNGYTVLLVREPGGTRLGERVRALLSERQPPAPTPMAELFLFLAARAQLINEMILPALNSGTHVICDRFADSTLAYQGYGRELNIEQITMLNKIAVDGLMPDITFLLDLEAHIGLQRVQGRQKAMGADVDRMEQETPAFHERVRAGYLDLVRREPKRFYRLDATRTPDELQQEIWDVAQRVV